MKPQYLPDGSIFYGNDIGPQPTWPADDDDSRYIAYCEEHGTEPEECRDCLALVDHVDAAGRCEECRPSDFRGDPPPVSAEDFSNPRPIGCDFEGTPF